MRLQVTLGEVVQKYTLVWMQIEGVIGAGEGEKNGKPCIHILVQKKTLSLINKLPANVDGYQVVLKEVGPSRKQ